MLSMREFSFNDWFQDGVTETFSANRWVEGALDSAYEAVRKMLEGAGLDEHLEQLDANWGNPNLTPAEFEEDKSLWKKQELIGALLSTTSDRKEIEEALRNLS